MLFTEETGPRRSWAITLAISALPPITSSARSDARRIRDVSVRCADRRAANASAGTTSWRMSAHWHVGKSLGRRTDGAQGQGDGGGERHADPRMGRVTTTEQLPPRGKQERDGGGDAEHPAERRGLRRGPDLEEVSGQRYPPVPTDEEPIDEEHDPGDDERREPPPDRSDCAPSIPPGDAEDEAGPR